MIGRYCFDNYPPSVQSISNRLEIKYASRVGGWVTGFVAYYESLGPAPNGITFMAAFRGGAYYSEAVVFLISTILDIPRGGYCLTFSYSMRSNLRVRITSHSYTTTLANWIVDGGRAFHHADLPLPEGMYKIIWETVDGRKDLGKPETPYHRYLVTVNEMHIHPNQCLDIGRLVW